MDSHFFLSLNGLAHVSPVLDAAGIFFAEYFPYLLGGSIVLFLAGQNADSTQNRRLVFTAVAAAILARLVTSGIRLFYFHPRPFVVLHSATQLVPVSVFEDLQASFPSAHAALFFALGTGVYCYNKKWGVVYLVGALLIGVARVFAGVHWPSDIVGGALVGVVSGWCMYALVNARRPR